MDFYKNIYHHSSRGFRRIKATALPEQENQLQKKQAPPRTKPVTSDPQQLGDLHKYITNEAAKRQSHVGLENV